MPTAVLERTIERTKEESVAVRDERARREEARARDFNGRISDNYSRLMSGEAVATLTPAQESVASQRISQYVSYNAPASSKKLFEGLTYRNGVLSDATKEAPAVEAVQVASPVVSAPEAYSEEDALPTAKTMSHRTESVAMEQSVQLGLFAGLSTKTKMVIAAIIFAVVVAIAVICLNTSVLGSMSAEYASLQSTSAELSEQYAELRERLAKLKSEENIADFAAENNMYRVEI